ncbi:pilus assembly protein PilM [Massilia sp. B-10]|nr:pilus assembly protein PilM [Massilia sp. B-10]
MGFFGKTKKVERIASIRFCCRWRLYKPHHTRDRRQAGGGTSQFFAVKQPLTPEALEKIARDAQAAQYHCATLLGGRDYQMLAVESPNVQPDELKAAVRWRLKDMLDFHVDDATIDVLDIPADPNASVRSNAMFAVAARNSVVEARMNLFMRAKVSMEVIDIPEMAQRNISAMLEPEGRGLAMLSFNEDGGLLTVSFPRRVVSVAPYRCHDRTGDGERSGPSQSVFRQGHP